MTAYEETLHVTRREKFEELNNEFAKVKLSEKLAYCRKISDSHLYTVKYTAWYFTQMSLDYLPGSLV